MKTKFTNINLKIFMYLLYASPLAIIAVVWSILFNKNTSGMPHTLFDFLGWHFVIWLSILVYMIITIFLNAKTREEILARVTFSQVRDERESFISGKAGRGTFYSTLGALILLFFISGLNIDIYRTKTPNPNGNNGIVSIGYDFSLIKDPNEIKRYGDKRVPDEDREVTIFRMKGIPFSQESILLFLILYHIAGYQVFARKRARQ